MGELVIDHLWQSSVFAGLMGVLTLAFRDDRAGIRFGLWFAASMKFLLPFSLFVTLGKHLRWGPVRSLPMGGEWSSVMDRIAQPASFMAAAGAGGAQPALAAPMIAAQPAPPQFDLALLAGIVWAAGCLALLLLWLVRWSRIRSMLKRSSPAPIAAPIPVMSVPAVLEPALFGVFRPVLLWPEGLADHLTGEQREAILAHELCHWRRRDNVAAMAHMAVEAIFWFYPLIWWLGRRLLVERERACDESVIEAGRTRQSYAEGILKVCQFCMEQKLLCVAAVSGGDLKKRIETIMTFKMPTRLHRVKKLLLVSAAMIAVAGPVLAGFALAPAVKPGEDPALPYQRMVEQRRDEQSRPRAEVRIDPALLDRYVGDYRLWNRIYTVTRNDGHLFVRLSGEVNQTAPDEIVPEGERDFFFKGRPAQASFAADEKGQARKLIIHQDGFDQIYRRVSEAEAKGIAEYLSRKIRENTPAPGVDAVLRRHYEALANGTIDYEDLGDNPAKNSRERQDMISRGAGTFGALRSITFLGVDSRGWDMYRITYAAREFENAVVFRPDGKIDGIGGIIDRSAPRKEAASEVRAADEFDGVRCKADISAALIGRRVADERVKSLEEKHRDISLKDLGAFGLDTEDSFEISWSICGQEYVLLEKQGIVRDAIPFPSHSRAAPASIGSCEIDGRMTSEIILAILRNDAGNGGKQDSYPAAQAWRIDQKDMKLVRIDTAGMRCPRLGIFTADGGL